jgi:RNAse (barnase) inhibitor barstar
MNAAMELGALLADPSQSGAYFVDLRDREALAEAGAALHFAVTPVELKGCVDADDAIARFAEALKFPDWFGGNWDALADCLNDLSWLPAGGYVLLLEHADEWCAEDRAGFDTAVEILNEAGARWAEAGQPFWAFLPTPARFLETMSGEQAA